MATTSSKQPGPKPDFLVVEHNLHCQTDDGELVLDLRVPFDTLEVFSSIDGMEPKTIPRFLLENIVPEDKREQLRKLQDGAKTYAILMKYSEAVGERLGVSLGEFDSSSDS